jgi:hypothetical protein
MMAAPLVNNELTLTTLSGHKLRLRDVLDRLNSFSMPSFIYLIKRRLVSQMQCSRGCHDRLVMSFLSAFASLVALAGRDFKGMALLT